MLCLPPFALGALVEILYSWLWHVCSLILPCGVKMTSDISNGSRASCFFVAASCVRPHSGKRWLHFSQRRYPLPRRNETHASSRSLSVRNMRRAWWSMLIQSNEMMGGDTVRLTKIVDYSIKSLRVVTHFQETSKSHAIHYTGSICIIFHYPD